MLAPNRLTRRGAILGPAGLAVVGLAGLAGCDTDDLRPHDHAAATPSATPGRPTADERLVDAVVDDVLTATAAVGAAHRLPPLQTVLAPLLEAHHAQLRVLRSTRKPAHVRRPASAAAGLQQVRAAEQAVQRELAGAALRAESGALAQLLASMSASAAQYVAALPESLP